MEDDESFEIPKKAFLGGLSFFGLIAIIAAFVPMILHFDVNGQDYVKLIGGGLTVLFALLALAWEGLRLLRKKPLRKTMGGLVPFLLVFVGVVHLLHVELRFERACDAGSKSAYEDAGR